MLNNKGTNREERCFLYLVDTLVGYNFQFEDFCNLFIKKDIM